MCPVKMYPLRTQVHFKPRAARRLVELVASGLLAFSFSVASADTLPSYQELKAAHRSSFISVQDRRGEQIALVRGNYKSMQLEWTALEDWCSG